MTNQNDEVLIIYSIINKILLKLNDIDDKWPKIIEILNKSKKKNARQQHGFDYEDHIIETYDLIKDENYGSKSDAFCHNGTYVQIKYIKENAEICMGSFSRNAIESQDFILHIGFYKKHNGIKQTTRSYTLWIIADIYKKFYELPNFSNIVSEFKKFSNLHSEDEKFKKFIKQHKYKGLVQIRFKRDHKTQRRIQAAIPYASLNEFISKFDECDLHIFNINNTSINNIM